MSVGGEPTFENPEIPVATLPTADALDWQALHRHYALQLQLQRLLQVLLAAAVLGVAGFTPIATHASLEWLWAGLLVLAPPFLFWPRIAVPRCGYVVRDRDIVYRSGVFRQTVTAVPFNRIQHAESRSNPLDRLFGTASLEIYTAGGSSSDLSISGLPGATAERLREHVLGRVGSIVEHE